jgi:hypothetical protein
MNSWMTEALQSRQQPDLQLFDIHSGASSDEAAEHDKAYNSNTAAAN